MRRRFTVASQGFALPQSAPAGHRARTQAGTVAAVLLAAVLGGCIEEETVVQPEVSAAVRKRSIRVDANSLITNTFTAADASKIGTAKTQDYTAVCIGANCGEYKQPDTDGLKVKSMQGINNTLKTIADDEDKSPLFNKSARSLTTFWARIPSGYGCKPLMQGLFPDRTKDTADMESYGIKDPNHLFNQLLGATRTMGAFPLWTASYDLGTVGDTCVYKDGQVVGKPIQDPAKWAKAVRRLAHFYDFDLKDVKNAASQGTVDEGPMCAKFKGQASKPWYCEVDPLCRSTDATTVKPWYCGQPLVAFEFLRDPFGAGGYQNTPADRAKWLEAYKYFANELREEFAIEVANIVKIVGPSVVIRGDLEVQDTGSSNRSPIYDFIDFVVDPKNKPAKGERLSLTHLSVEIEAGSPGEAKQIIKRIADYAAAKGLKAEKGADGAKGTEPIPIWVTDLRITKAPTDVAALNDSKSSMYDTWRYAAWRGGFFASTKMLWQGLVTEATIGQLVRIPTLNPEDPAVDKVQLATTAKESDFLWFSQQKIANGALKPTGWDTFWFHGDHMGRKQMVAVQHGPDAVNMSGNQASNPDVGIIALATRTSCVNVLNEPTECTTPDKNDIFGYVTKDRKRMMRIMVADNEIKVTAGRQTLMHDLRIQVDGLPADAKVAGYKFAWVDGTEATWTDHLYRDLGQVDITNGSLSFTRPVAVPATLYLELYF
jgi:hypothetical protein